MPVARYDGLETVQNFAVNCKRVYRVGFTRIGHVFGSADMAEMASSFHRQQLTSHHVLERGVIRVPLVS